MTSLVLLLHLIFAQNFETVSDRLVALEVIDSFSKECAYISSIEGNIVARLEDKLKEAQASDNDQALTCYRDNLTQVTSAHYIYKNVCDELIKSSKERSDAENMRLFVAIQKYRKGIRLQHGLLNNCLANSEVDPSFIVDLEFNRIESDLLRDHLRAYRVKEIFTPNRTTYK